MPNFADLNLARL